MAAYRRVDDLRSPAGWLPVHRDQLRAQRSVSSTGKPLALLLIGALQIGFIYVYHKALIVYRLSTGNEAYGDVIARVQPDAATASHMHFRQSWMAFTVISYSISCITTSYRVKWRHSNPWSPSCGTTRHTSVCEVKRWKFVALFD